MTSLDRPNGSDGLAPDSDFGKALIQAMDDFSHSAAAPAFDSTGIVRRTRRRRRGVLVLAGTAAAVAAAVTLTVTLGTGPGRPAVAVAAAPSSSLDSALPPKADVAQPVPDDTEPNAVVVPDLVGMNRTEATAALRALGLDISVGSTSIAVPREVVPSAHAGLIGPDGQFAPGLVEFTSPAAGHRVAPGTIVAAMIGH